MTPMKPLRAVSSWWLTAALLLCLFAPYLFFSLGRNPYPYWISFVFRSPAGISLFLALIVNLVAASVRVVLRRIRSMPISIESIRSMDIHETVPVPDEQTLATVSGWMREKAPSRDIRDGGILHITGRFSFLPGTLFRLGIIITLSAAMISAHSRTTYDAVFPEGEYRAIPGTGPMVAAIRANLPEDFLQVGDEGLFQLERVNAALTAAGKTYEITPGFPRKIEGRYFRIVHLGYSQYLTITGPDRREERREDLDVLPPGKTAVVPLPPGKAFLTFTLEPDRTIARGLVTGRQYNLAAPRYRIVTREGGGKENPESVVVRPGGRAEFGPLRVSLGKQSPFVRVRIVLDPALPWLYAGGMLTMAGSLFMLSRFFWYERKLSAIMLGGTLIVGYDEEFFKKWGIDKFQRWVDKLPERAMP